MSYRSRLLLYVGMLMVLLVGMMTLSFKAARDVIAGTTSAYLSYIADHQGAMLAKQRHALSREAALLAAEAHLRASLRDGLHDRRQEHGVLEDSVRRYGMPGDIALVLSATGEILLGAPQRKLRQALRAIALTDDARSFYLPAGGDVLMVALHPVLASGRRLGTVLVGRYMDQRWLTGEQSVSSDYLLFFASQGRILRSSNPRYQGASIDSAGRHLEYEDDRFRLREISYQPGLPGQVLPGLWFGINESATARLLAGYEYWLLFFAVLGSLAVALVGWLVLRNFSRPMSALMLITRQMMNGELPVMKRSHAKSEMDQLVNRFADVLDSLRREQAKLEMANRKLQETAITDSLTGLYNRRYLQEVAPGLFAQVVRDDRYLTAVLIDLDHFKAINDSWGHLGGDAVLVHFAQLLQHNSRANDFLFRIGGEEFLILNVAENPADSVALAEKFRELVSCSPASYQGSTIPLTVSIGVSCCYGKSGDISLSVLMRAADKSLYQAKSSGRNTVVLHSSCRQKAVQRPTGRPRITVIEGGNSGKRRT